MTIDLVYSPYSSPEKPWASAFYRHQSAIGLHAAGFEVANHVAGFIAGMEIIGTATRRRAPDNKPSSQMSDDDAY